MRVVSNDPKLAILCSYYSRCTLITRSGNSSLGMTCHHKSCFHCKKLVSLLWRCGIFKLQMIIAAVCAFTCMIVIELLQVDQIWLVCQDCSGGFEQPTFEASGGLSNEAAVQLSTIAEENRARTLYLTTYTLRQRYQWLRAAPRVHWHHQASGPPSCRRSKVLNVVVRKGTTSMAFVWHPSQYLILQGHGPRMKSDRHSHLRPLSSKPHRYPKMTRS